MPFNRVLQPAAAFSPTLPGAWDMQSLKEVIPPPRPPFLFIYLRTREEWDVVDARNMGSTEGYLDVEGEKRSWESAVYNLWPYMGRASLGKT